MKILYMKSLKLIYIPLLFWVCLTGCKREITREPIDKDATAPGVVTNIKVVNTNGGATLTYSLPDDKNLLYVKAVYETSKGHSQEVKASYYTNSMQLSCFGDTLEHTVSLYAVNKSEVASAPVTVTVNPHTAPCVLTFRTLKIIPAFGGINIKASNSAKADLAIVPLVDTLNNGDWATLDNIYTADSSINTNIRGLDTTTRKYGFYVRDRCGNRSDTLVLTLSPLFEKKLDKKLWSERRLPGDAVTVYGTKIQDMWNGQDNHGWPVTFTDEGAGSPQTFTIDLGLTSTFSRLKVNSYEDFGVYFGRGAIKIFQIWGSNNPNSNGSYDASWDKLLDCTVIKPSGSPLGTETGADKAAGFAGSQFDFPSGTPAYRFIRIKCLQNWQGSYFMSIVQFTLWGKQ